VWWGEVPEPWALHEARLHWWRARMEWVRQVGATTAALAALFGPGYDPASDDPRSGVRERRRLERTLLPRAEWTHAAA
jgi:hypothetical protein